MVNCICKYNDLYIFSNLWQENYTYLQKNKNQKKPQRFRETDHFKPAHEQPSNDNMERLLGITNSFQETIDKSGKTIFRESEGSNDRGSSVSFLAQPNFIYKGQHPPSTFDERVTNAGQTLRRSNNDDHHPPSTFDE